MLLNIYITISILADILITLFGDLVNRIGDIWKPILLFIGLFFACLIIHVIALVAVSTLSKKEGEVVKPVRWMVIQTIEILLPLLRVKVHTTGMELLPKDQHFLLVCNHRSIFEPIITLELFKEYNLAFVSKVENLKIPIIKWMINSTGSIGLDRDDDRAAVRTVIKAANLIKSGTVSMGIYPEGKRNRTDEPLLPFRNGSFKIAQRAGVPIVAITACGMERIPKRMILRRTDVYIDILKVLPSDEIANINTNEICDQVYDIMRENIIKRDSL